MHAVTIEEVGQHIGQEVTLRGWVYNKRSSGKIRFILLRDGTGIIQCVLATGEVDDETFEKFGPLTQETSVMVTGVVNEDRRAPSGCELLVRQLEIGQIAADYPITPKEHSTGYLLDRRHLWIRSARQSAILRIRAEVIKAMRDFLDDDGFVLADTPIFTPTSCEGTSTLFETKYFDRTAYLSQSGQLYNEATAMALGKVYCFGPAFRAEKSKTRRHLTEFWQVEPEAAYYDLDDMVDVVERMIVYLVRSVLQKKARELEALGRDTSSLQQLESPFPKITYDEALEILKREGMRIEYGSDFGAPAETVLSNEFDRPVFVMNYPLSAKEFYMKEHPENKELVLCFDVLAPEGFGEIVGGSQRVDDVETLERRLRDFNLPREPFEWYLDLRRFGSVPHSGFGMGVERTVAWICGINHIRETIPFPRTLYRITP
ncbi:MAG: asparagine--tRNA ligase [Candidatus Coatesbacteria bacterium]|nr:asparagine--tRNA ligase [Candidatus Coatesbacteria bacterium]